MLRKGGDIWHAVFRKRDLTQVVDQHNNKEMMKKVKCPTFMIHGEADTLIPSTHSH